MFVTLTLKYQYTTLCPVDGRKVHDLKKMPLKTVQYFLIFFLMWFKSVNSVQCIFICINQTFTPFNKTFVNKKFTKQNVLYALKKNEEKRTLFNITFLSLNYQNLRCVHTVTSQPGEIRSPSVQLTALHTLFCFPFFFFFSFQQDWELKALDSRRMEEKQKCQHTN